tara:strand:+ start:1097 stop:1537 length:441 start_codon:yes stop_codon:yes gene_type:complete
METTKEKKWKLIGHSHQIADTGDYDGHYELTNGKISLLTKEDDDEAIQPIADALNDSGIKFYQDDFFEFENRIIKQELDELRKHSTSQKETIERLYDTVTKIKNPYSEEKQYQQWAAAENVLDIIIRSKPFQEAEQLLSTTEPIDQ